MFFRGILLTMLNVSCATMYNSGNQSMQVVASDGGTHKVNISTPDGSYTTNLPTTITAPPSTFKDVEIKVDGSKCINPTSSVVRKSITPSFWANVFNGGWGFLLDPVTGAMWKYDGQTTITMSKNGTCEG